MINGFFSKWILNIETVDLLQRFLMSLILTISVLLFAAGIIHSIPSLISSTLQFIFTTTIVIWCGFPILKRGYLSVIRYHLDMFTLIAISIIISYGYGVFTLFFTNIFPTVFTVNTNVYFLFEVAAIITTIALLEQIFEIQTWKKAKGELHSTEWMMTPLERLTQLLCNYFVFIVLIIALMIFALTPELNYGFISTISVLIIACPRAITLPAPIAFLSGIRCGKKLGIIINNPTCLERLEKVNLLVVDNISTTEQSASLALKLLHEEGIRIVMVTSDDFSTAEKIANNLGIDTIETQISPQQKNVVADRLRQQGFIVAMTKNNVNDVGITLEINADHDNQGLNIRFEKNDLLDVLQARQLSKKVMNNIRQNLFFSFIYNLFCIPIAAGVFYFWTGIIFNPIISTVLMFLCVVLVTMNALRLQKIDFITLQHEGDQKR